MTTGAPHAQRRIGALVVDVTLRSVQGPSGSCSIEPRVLDVLLALTDADGAVVSRTALLARCWPGRVVGDDAVNRAIGEVRRIARLCSDGSIELLTIPKSGWRLVQQPPALAMAAPADGVARMTPGEPSFDRAQEALPPSSAGVPAQAEDAAASPQAPPVTRGEGRRRWLRGAASAAGVAAIVAALASPGVRRFLMPADPAAERASRRIEDADRKLQTGLHDATREAIALLSEAVREAPTLARAWGRLAVAWRDAAAHGPVREVAAAVAASDGAARRALALDPRQPDAHAAAALLNPYFGEWARAESRLRAVLAAAPRQADAMSGMALLLKSVGRDAEGAVFSRGVAAQQPLSPLHAYRLAYVLWSEGRIAEADRELDRAASLHPGHPGVWTTQLLLLALTSRVPAARAMLDDGATRPAYVGEPIQRLFSRSFAALESRESAVVDEAVALHEAAARSGPGGAIRAMLFLSQLDRLDSAFAVAEGYYLRRGPLAGVVQRADGLPSVNEYDERKTLVLFVPATAALRADPRFDALSEEIGLAAYWRALGVLPDYVRAGGQESGVRPRA